MSWFDSIQTWYRLRIDRDCRLWCFLCRCLDLRRWLAI